MRNFTSYLRVLLIVFIVFCAAEYFIDSGSKPAFIEYPQVAIFLVLFTLLLVAVEIVVASMNSLTKALLSEEQLKEAEENSWYKNLLKKLTKTKPIEEEGEIILDHNYDGIKELDNSLPPWWLYGFYASILFAAIYLIKYEVLKHTFGKLTPVVNLSTPENQKKKIIWNSRLYVFIWVSIFVFSYYIGSILPVLYIILPTYYGKPIWFAVNVTQHLGAAIDTKDHRLSSYSIKINPILSFLYWKMEYHLEHHMFPMVPSYNLKKIQNEIKDQLPKPFNGLYDFYKSVLPSVIKLTTNPKSYYKVNLQLNNK